MICWINPFTGLAGDMLLAALIDAGAPLDGIRDAITSTGLAGWRIDATPTVTHGLAATRLRVDVTDAATERRAAELLELARAAPPQVADFAVAALTAIAGVEAALHGVKPADVHLHELGGHDTLIDIVGVGAALHLLGIRQVHCAPLPVGGGGTVRTRHGVLPLPAPATIALLSGAQVTGTDLPGETITPTAAAVLTAAKARYGPMPTITVVRTGYGAGTRTLPDRPNVASVTLGQPIDAAPEPFVVLETNLDDVTGETLGYVIDAALAAGARDAWATPAVMKKGRPAYVLHILTRRDDADRLRRLMLAETGTLGVRAVTVERTAEPRSFSVVSLGGHQVRLKHGPHATKPEHDDLVTAARALDIPLRDAAAQAIRLCSEVGETR